VRQLESAAAIAAGPAGAVLNVAKNSDDKKDPPDSPDAGRPVRLRAALRRPDPTKGPSWAIILGFTAAFAATYSVHMYVAEVYVAGDATYVYSDSLGESAGPFVFLLVKYCGGFLFVLLVPLITLATERDIRTGVRAVFGSAVLCLQDMEEGCPVEEDGIPVGEDPESGQEERGSLLQPEPVEGEIEAEQQEPAVAVMTEVPEAAPITVQTAIPTVEA